MVTIRELRESRGMTQVEYAAALGVSPATVYAWEARRSEPSVTQLRHVAGSSGVTMDEIDCEPTRRRSRAKRSTPPDADTPD